MALPTYIAGTAWCSTSASGAERLAWPMSNGATLPTTVNVEKAPCAPPCTSLGSCACNVATAAPNQHSAHRYCSSSQRIATSKLCASSMADQHTAAPTEPAIGSHSLRAASRSPSLSESAPPAIAENPPPKAEMEAFARAKSASCSGNAPRPHGPTHTAIEKPAQKRNAHEKRRSCTAGRCETAAAVRPSEAICSAIRVRAPLNASPSTDADAASAGASVRAAEPCGSRSRGSSSVSAAPAASSAPSAAAAYNVPLQPSASSSKIDSAASPPPT
mmetsp:Transcript_18176/g.56622  ORF Transcript_18176/g.56622 Transcript_18176/m.56622 type:complete len:274 (-) Transcript_18176:371-1192(-)